MVLPEAGTLGDHLWQNRTMEISDTLGFLLGTWRVTRRIENQKLGAFGSFEGTALLAEHDLGNPSTGSGRARYEETGELRIGTYSGQAHRSLEFVRLEDATVALYFTDHRLFIDLDLRTGASYADHLCGDDCYQIGTVVRSHRVVQEHWRVRGPTTDYDAVTTLERMGRRIPSRSALVAGSGLWARGSRRVRD